ncbi:protein NATD1-like isoform 1-T1 [Menidia menidia]
MASKITSRLCGLTRQIRSSQTNLRARSCGGGLTVEHDRTNRRFTVAPGPGTGELTAGTEALFPGVQEQAVLLYRFTAEKEVDLMSTFVPETFRGQGVAALLSQAAMDFLVQEKLKARISCWYIKKYVEDHPEQLYKELVIS